MLTPSEPYPDLSCFGTETDRRIPLLIFAIIAASIYILHVESVTTLLADKLQHCMQLAISSQLPSSMTSVDGLPRTCGVEIDRWRVLWISAGLLILLSVGQLIYWLTPHWRISHAKLRPLEQNPLATMLFNGQQVHITTVLEQMRITYIPKVHLCYLTTRGKTGQDLPSVFAGLGQAYLVIPGQLVAQFQQNPPLFRAVILHEFAHFQHQDVKKTYWAEALTLAFGFVLFVYFGFTLWSLLFVSASPSPHADKVFVLDQFCQSAIIAGVVWMLYLAVRRTRESAADVQASYWAGTDPILQAALEQILLKLDKRRRPWWRVALSFYPDERFLNVHKPQKLFALHYGEAIAIGVIASLSLTTFYPLVLTLFAALNVNFSILTFVSPAMVGFFFTCALLVTAIGQMIWRALLLVKLNSTTQVGGIGLVGICLSVGLGLGFLCSLQFSVLLAYISASWQILLIYGGSLALIFVIGIGSFCCWIAGSAEAWLDVIYSKRMSHWVSRIHLTIASIVLTICMACWIIICVLTLGSLLPQAINSQVLSQPIALHETDTTRVFILNFTIVIINLLQLPVAAGGLSALCYLPLLSCFWYRRGRALNSFTWALIDGKQFMRPASQPALFSWGLVTETVLILGTCFFALFLLFHQASLALANTVQLRSNSLLIILLSSLMRGLWPALVAVIIYRETSTHRIINGLLGALLSEPVIAMSCFLVYHLFQGTVGLPIPNYTFWQSLWPTLSWGSISLWIWLWVLNDWPRKALPEQSTKPTRTPLNGRLSRRWLLLISLVLIIIAILLPHYRDTHKPTAATSTNIVQNGDFEIPRVTQDFLWPENYLSQQMVQDKYLSPLDSDHWPHAGATLLYDHDESMQEQVMRPGQMDPGFRRQRVTYAALSTTIAIGKTFKAMQRGYTISAQLSLMRGRTR